MDVRSYDPAIARWTSIDPVTHYSMSTYNAFDNNPVFWADPSGADAKSFLNDIWNKSGSGETTWINNDDGTFSGSNGETVVDDDYVYNKSKGELEAIVKDLNSIYKSKYGETPFSVDVKTRIGKKLVKKAPWYKPWADDVYEDYEYDVYILSGSVAFNWDRDKYTKMLRQVMDSDEYILTDIVNDTKRGYAGQYYETGKGFLSDYRGGITLGTNHVNLSVKLKYYDNAGASEHTLGGVFLHEVLFHIHPNGAKDKDSSTLRKFYNLKLGRNTHLGSSKVRNQKIKH
jgi:hypothetical protein